ncbi:hypothetical protein EOS_35580 [Caballeronia mineralivorans PML1(12)]|uniref:Flagellar FliJ protein n=1 Tax=Caballeronia mineralivorans PML1(12) TaxID=908627 RepID=A0A0J1CL55_9BURK|nr:hypothetical protein [Caballeronia mineralivorans]KLU21495.1 hypothetical protein EOS_35580 [Caballeronia mineralivorans PML1(12)]
MLDQLLAVKACREVGIRSRIASIDRQEKECIERRVRLFDRQQELRAERAALFKGAPVVGPDAFQRLKRSLAALYEEECTVIAEVNAIREDLITCKAERENRFVELRQNLRSQEKLTILLEVGDDAR